MYSVVLMAALTAGTTTPSWGWGCHGCSGGSGGCHGCHGCHGGCWGSGYGACYGCSVEIDGVLQRLCVAGPVLEAA